MTARTDIERLVAELLDVNEIRENRDLAAQLLRVASRLAGDRPDRLDLKIATAALREMREAFKMFAPYRSVPKVTIFGSARTHRDHPLYAQARALARQLADAGWMVITGAGPGIMAAGIEGAGRERAFGVNIRLPFEQAANELIAGDAKLVEMRYFFTRKLMLMKESKAFVALPGGFGTLDETFELLTLQQTGKAIPAPVVLVDVPSGSYWHAFQRFLAQEVAPMALISALDLELFRITDSVATAVDEITGYFRNYHSSRYLGEHLYIRVHAAPTDDELVDINRHFADVCVGGGIEVVDAHPDERDDETPHLPRVALHFDRLSYGRLHQLIRHLNGLVVAREA